MDFPFLIYGVGLAAAMVAACLTVMVHPDWRLARSAVTVFANWLVGTVFALSTGITDGWWFNILIDGAAAAAIFYRLAGRWQAALGITYCVQLLGHAYYGWQLGRGVALPWSYYGWLTAIAWLQLLLIGAWAADTWLRGSAGANRDRRSSSGTGRGAEPGT